MNLENFIKKNRKQIDKIIKRTWPEVKPLNDAERKVWILNEMSLLHWAEAQGVKIDAELERVRFARFTTSSGFTSSAWRPDAFASFT